MTNSEDDTKQPAISKKWLYGSLAIIALILGVFLNDNALASEYEYESVAQVETDNEEDAVGSDSDSDDYENSVEDDMED